MEQGYQKRVLAMASASAREHGKIGDLNNIVAALKVRHPPHPSSLGGTVLIRYGVPQTGWGADTGGKQAQLYVLKRNSEGWCVLSTWLPACT